MADKGCKETVRQTRGAQEKSEKFTRGEWYTGEERGGIRRGDGCCRLHRLLNLRGACMV